MSKSKTNLAWIDLEMTGLEDHQVIIEIASLVTNSNLVELAEGPVIAIHRKPEETDNINAWSKEQHTKSGLLKRVSESNISLKKAEQLTLDFFQLWIDKGTSPLCGNSIGTDRRFIRKEMPLLDAFLHYRLIDVSTVKELATRWYPKKTIPTKKSEHLALADIRESVEELRWYKENVFLPSTE